MLNIQERFNNCRGRIYSQYAINGALNNDGVGKRLKRPKCGKLINLGGGVIISSGEGIGKLKKNMQVPIIRQLREVIIKKNI